MAVNLLHHHLAPIFFLLLLALLPPSIVQARTLNRKGQHNPFIKTLQSLEGVHKGQTVKGLGELKLYLQKFGYFVNTQHPNKAGNKPTITNQFDDNLEYALRDYQKYHHLVVTGLLDAATIKHIALPRCGVPDIIPKHDSKHSRLTFVANYNFFPNGQKWEDSRRDLSYTFRSSVDVLDSDQVRQAVANAFNSWASVTYFGFYEAGEGEGADIVIGFHRGDHGDGYPFDGPGSVLAHAFAPQDGRLHYDADETWTTEHENGNGEIDLETVALHEIGHILGLGHSSDSNSVMYPSYRGERRDLGQDDIDGIRNLYQYN